MSDDHVSDVYSVAGFLSRSRGRMFCADCLSHTLGRTGAEIRSEMNRLRLTAGFSIGAAPCWACRRVKLVVGFAETTA